MFVVTGFGNGSFAVPQMFALDHNPQDAVATDLDGDGIDDVTVTGDDSVVTIVSAGHTIL